MDLQQNGSMYLLSRYLAAFAVIAPHLEVPAHARGVGRRRVGVEHALFSSPQIEECDPDMGACVRM